MKLRNLIMIIASPLIFSSATADEKKLVTVSHTKLTGIGPEKGVMRRDPSDVIKVGDLFYVWYSKGKISPGYDATLWYATSKDGLAWEEKGMALDKGEKGSWEGASVFTPNILVANEKYYLFYTGTSREWAKKPFNPDSKIGVAISDSPDGPWVRGDANPNTGSTTKVVNWGNHRVKRKWGSPLLISQKALIPSTKAIP